MGGVDANSIDFALSITNLFSSYMVYIVIGYWINRDGLAKVPDALLIVSTVLALLLSTGYQYYAFSRPGNYIIKYHSVGILITSLLLFECFKRYSKRIIKMRKPIIILSIISFGIYFVHICIMGAIKNIIPTSIGYVPYFFALEIISFAGSVVIIMLLMRFKRLSRLLFRI